MIVELALGKGSPRNCHTGSAADTRASCMGLQRTRASRSPSFGVLLGLCFCLLARTGELFLLDGRLVVFGAAPCVIFFEYTKRWQRLGIDEGITLTDEASICCLRALCVGLAPGDKVLGYTERRLRQAWSHVSACLGLSTRSGLPS